MTTVEIAAILCAGLFAGMVLAAIRSATLSAVVVVGTFGLGLWQLRVFDGGPGDVTIINHFVLGAYALWTGAMMVAVLVIVGMVRWWRQMWRDIGPAAQRGEAE